MIIAQKILRRRALQLCRDHGVPIAARRNVAWYDGRVVSAGPEVDTWRVLHEAAHWLVASKAARRIVNFGLGWVHGTPSRIESPSMFTASKSDLVESKASLLGILFLVWIEDEDWPVVFSGGNWDCVGYADGVDELKKTLAIARARGIRFPRKIPAAFREELRATQVTA